MTLTQAELAKRLATMTPALIAQVSAMIAQGYGAQGISLESSASLKQANAVFALVELTISGQPLSVNVQRALKGLPLLAKRGRTSRRAA